MNHLVFDSKGKSSHNVLFQCSAGECPGPRASIGEGDSGSRSDGCSDPRERNGGHGEANEELVPARQNASPQHGGTEVTAGESATVAGEEQSPGERRRGCSSCGRRADHQRPLRHRRLQLRQRDHPRESSESSGEHPLTCPEES